MQQCLLFFFGVGGSRAATMAYVRISIAVITLSRGSVGPRFTYFIEHILQLVLRQRTALDVLDSTELLSHSLSFLFPHRLHLLFGQLFPHTGVISQVCLRAHNKARDAGAMVVDFGKPFLADVLEGGWRGDAEAYEENVGLGV